MVWKSNHLIQRTASFRAIILVKYLTLSPQIRNPDRMQTLHRHHWHHKAVHVILLMDTIWSTSHYRKLNEFTTVFCSASQLGMFFHMQWSMNQRSILFLASMHCNARRRKWRSCSGWCWPAGFSLKAVMVFKGSNNGWTWILLNQKEVHKAAISLHVLFHTTDWLKFQAWTSQTNIGTQLVLGIDNVSTTSL